MKTIVVFGAGITGITTAYALQKRGFDVTVIDRQRYAAMDTSFANGGQLSASNAEVWTRWKTVLKGMKWMFNPDAPLLVNPKPSWHKYSWMMEFLSSIPQYEKNTIQTAKMALAAREPLLEWAKETGTEFDPEMRGILHIYRTKAEYDHATEVNGFLKKAGLERQAMTTAEMKAMEPALSGNYHGGYYTESDFTGDIHKYTMGLAKAFEKNGGKMMMQTEVSSVTADGSNGVSAMVKQNDEIKMLTFDACVVSAGIGSRHIAQQLGDRVNIYPVKGYSITVDLSDKESQDAAPHVSLLDDETKLVSSRLGDKRLRVAGTAEFNGYNRDIRADRIKPLVDWVNQCFPGVSTETVTPWAGLRPMMPNMMPRVGKGKKQGVFYNTGHGHLGWTLCGFTAESIAALVAAEAMSNEPRVVPVGKGAAKAAD